ncbi:hypothetical protein OH492_04200 [Vibrio chagasii]|nr:hypothetical protein [Vibrio chagasii]
MTILFLPSATLLVGMFSSRKSLMREAGVVDRPSKTAQNELINAGNYLPWLGWF